MNTFGYESELSVLQGAIQASLNNLHKKWEERVQQEKALCHLVISENLLLDLKGSEPSTDEEVASIMKSAGEDDAIENDCFQRYKKFCELKEMSFSSAESKIQVAVKLLDSIIAADHAVRRPNSFSVLDQNATAENKEALPNLRALWQSVIHLNEILCSISSQATNLVVLDQSKNSATDGEEPGTDEINLEKTLSHVENLLSSSMEARKKIVAELESVRGVVEPDIWLSESIIDAEVTDTSNGSLFCEELDSAYRELQTSTECWRQKIIDTDRSNDSLKERIDASASQTVIHKRAGEVLLTSTEEMSKYIKHLADRLESIRATLRLKECEYVRQKALLKEELDRQAILSKSIARLAEEEESRVKSLAAAGEMQRSTIAKLNAGYANSLKLGTTIDRIREELHDVLAEKRNLRDDIDYLSTLAINSSALAPSSGVSPDDAAAHSNTNLITREYLSFVQKARALRRHCFTDEISNSSESVFPSVHCQRC